MTNKKETLLVTNGDSWTFGCEIVDPNIINKYPKAKSLTEIDHLQENDGYRLTRIWPTFLADQLNADVINLAEPGDDNTSILNRTQEYILQLKASNVDYKNIFVVVGWTSPERRDFWYKSDDNKISFKFKMNPHGVESDQRPITELTKIYASNFWNPEEYLLRYVTTIYNFQNFCEQQKINYMSFNAFYRQKNLNIHEWTDIDIGDQLNKLDYPAAGITYNRDPNRINHKPKHSLIWDQIDKRKFYDTTFKNYVDTYCGDSGYNGWHPNELGHRLWSVNLYDYIIKNELSKPSTSSI